MQRSWLIGSGIAFPTRKVCKNQGWRQDLPDWGVGFPNRGLNNRIEGLFLCIIKQFSIKNSPTDTKFFPDGGVTLPEEGATAPQPPLAPPLATMFAALTVSRNRWTRFLMCWKNCALGQSQNSRKGRGSSTRKVSGFRKKQCTLHVTQNYANFLQRSYKNSACCGKHQI